MKALATVLLIYTIFVGNSLVFSYPNELSDIDEEPESDFGASGFGGDDGAGFDYGQDEDENASSTTNTTSKPKLVIKDLDLGFDEEVKVKNDSLIGNSSIPDGSVVRGRSGDGDTFSTDYEATNSRKEIVELDENSRAEEPSLDTIGGGPSRGDLPGVGFDYYNGNYYPETTDKIPEDTKEDGIVNKSGIAYYGYYWDQMGLLIFIILCIILLTILIFCCYIVRHMYDWAIIKVVKTSGDQMAVKYTVGHGNESESREMVQLMSISNMYVEPRVMDAAMLEKVKREMEFGYTNSAQKQEIHRTTAQLEIGSAEETKFPAVTVLVRPQNPTAKRPDSATAVMKQEWMADIFKTMESEPDQDISYNEIERLNQKKQQRMSSNIEVRKKNVNQTNTKHSQSLENILNANEANGANQEGLTFLEKFGVTSRTNTIKTTAHTTKTVVSASSSNVLITSDVNKLSAEQRSVSRSRDDLGDEDMGDYLEAYNGYPV